MPDPDKIEVWPRVRRLGKIGKVIGIALMDVADEMLDEGEDSRKHVIVEVEESTEQDGTKTVEV